MAKAAFLRPFQENMREFIHQRTFHEWGLKHLEVSTEDSWLSGTFNGFIYISIRSQRNPDFILAIEIEHKSSYLQATRNILKLKEWAHKSNYRQCGLLHVFNKGSNIAIDPIADLIRMAKQEEKKNKGFAYDFILYSVADGRATRRTAEELVYSQEFELRLWLLLQEIGLV